MHDLGTVFPPRDEWDIAAYDTDEVVAGYRSHTKDDPVPGPNHSPGFRWGWTNCRKDCTGIPDGFEPIRRAFIKLDEERQMVPPVFSSSLPSRSSSLEGEGCREDLGINPRMRDRA